MFYSIQDIAKLILHVVRGRYQYQSVFIVCSRSSISFSLVSDYISHQHLTLSICILSDLDPLLFITFILHSLHSVPAIPLGAPTGLSSSRFSILPSIFTIPFCPARTYLILHFSQPPACRLIDFS